MTKKFISIIISIIMCMCMISPVTTCAKVIEPEVVKTEKWTTSYYIDDDIDTLYPYIQCEADIYNDGTIKLYMWNTHEWDGFATVSHRVTVYEPIFVSQLGFVYCAKYGGNPVIDGKELTSVNYRLNEPIDDIPINFISGKYTYQIDNTRSIFGVWWGGNGKTFYSFSPNSGSHGYTASVSRISIVSSLAKLGYYSSRNGCSYTFKPTEDPTETYNFRLFGHDITITPELLSGNIVATPSDDGYKTITYNNGSSTSRIKTDTDVSDIQEHIDKLEAENALLRQENTEYKNKINLLATGTYGDVNSGAVVDVQDAQIILAYYTERDVAKKSVPDLVTFGLNFGKD